MVLSKEVRGRLDGVLREFRHGDRLRQHTLSPRRKLLLTGPPGTGKTMTAEALAGELGLPLLRIQFHTLITKFMGETAAKLHLIFESMKRAKGVYFFDEFDAIGSHRGTSNDVGEARRVLNSFLMFLEDDRSDGLVLAATNLPDLLDNALFRRFDDVVEYKNPTTTMIDDLVKNRLTMFEIVEWNATKIRKEAAGLSHAQIVRACEDAARDAVLSGTKGIHFDDLLGAMRRRKPTTRK